MTISVIIPVYNGIPFIKDALESVLAQTITIDEVICIDDASEDGTYDFISTEYPKVKLLRNEQNQGPSYSRNRGIEIAKGDLIAFLDADDIWEPNKTEWQLEQFHKDNSLEVIGGLCEYFKSSENTSREIIMRPHFNAYLGLLLIKRSVFDTVGVFDNSLRLSEDQDWFLRIRESEIKIKIVEKTILYYRVHQHNTTKDLNFKQLGLMKAIKQSLDRRRESSQMKELDKIDIVNPNR